MTVTSIITRQPVADPAATLEAEPGHPLVAAVLALGGLFADELQVDAKDCRAESIALLAGREHVDRIRDIGHLLDRARDLENGYLDHEVGSDRAAEIEAKRLRDEALMCAQLVASLIDVDRRLGWTR